MHELEANRAQWDERTQIHLRSAFYDVEGFKSGRCTLKPVELDELGNVEGKRLLHLQCHFGLDSLSWVRRGALATGVDFSSEAIRVARELASELKLECEFICSDIYDLPKKLNHRFEIVFTSYGVLTWLPDLKGWAEVIAHFLEEGGRFYIVDRHPFSETLVEEEGSLVAAEPYFDVGAIAVTAEGTYAEPTAVLANETSYQWQHPLSEVINALAGAGLGVEFLHEFPFFEAPCLPSMVRGADGYWRLPDRNDLPFLFSLLARATS